MRRIVLGILIAFLVSTVVLANEYKDTYVQRLYPDLVYPYNNIAVIYYQQKNYQEAIKYFKLAEQKDPFDTIVINNIAYLSMIIGDKDTSLKYYEKLREYGDEKYKEIAEQQIKELMER